MELYHLTDHVVLRVRVVHLDVGISFRLRFRAEWRWSGGLGLGLEKEGGRQRVDRPVELVFALATRFPCPLTLDVAHALQERRPVDGRLHHWAEVQSLLRRETEARVCLDGKNRSEGFTRLPQCLTRWWKACDGGRDRTWAWRPPPSRTPGRPCEKRKAWLIRCFIGIRRGFTHLLKVSFSCTSKILKELNPQNGSEPFVPSPSFPSLPAYLPLPTASLILPSTSYSPLSPLPLPLGFAPLYYVASICHNTFKTSKHSKFR